MSRVRRAVDLYCVGPRACPAWLRRLAALTLPLSLPLYALTLAAAIGLMAVGAALITIANDCLGAWRRSR